MKIIVDENMPYAYELFSQMGTVVPVAGRPFPVAVLDDADALMVRSVTTVDNALLNGKPVKFVGSATAGTDHIDQHFLRQAEIGFSAAPGCNAIAVVEYVFSALLLLAERDQFCLTDRTVGIVGVGNVGERLHKRLAALGVRTLLCDPPRASRGDVGPFCSLQEIVAEADVVTFHTPLNNGGPYNTLHMVDKTLLAALKANTIVINACRGAVVDNQALQSILSQRDDLSVILDVWEPEPDLSPELLAQVDIGTPHIAGYSQEGKARGTAQIYEAWTQFLGQSQQVTLSALLPAPAFSTVMMHGPLGQDMLKRLVHLVYDVRRDDALLRQVAGLPGEFERLRKQYAPRREWSSLSVLCDDASAARLLQELGFNAVYQAA